MEQEKSTAVVIVYEHSAFASSHVFNVHRCESSHAVRNAGIQVPFTSRSAPSQNTPFEHEYSIGAVKVPKPPTQLLWTVHE